MGITAFIVLVLLETALAAKTCRKETDKKTWRREKLAVRGLETGIIVLFTVYSAGQKWRFYPAIVFLVFLLTAGAAAMAVKKNREDGLKKPAGAVVSCVICILLFGLLLTPAFLFTDYHGLPVSGPHPVKETFAILTDESRRDPFEQDGSCREVPVHFYYPEDAEEGETFPLVVFSHGAFGYYQSNTSTYTELASGGYVVAALDHPHHAVFTTDTEGKTVTADSDFISAAINLNDETDKETQFARYTEWMALRTADMNFAVDEIRNSVQTGTDESWFISGSETEKIHDVLQMTDIGRIGLMGHSMGGATAAELGRRRDDVSAVVDLDGTMLGEYLGVENGEMLVRDVPYPVPVLDFNNWESYNDIMEYEAAGGCYPNTEVVRGAAEGFSVTVRGTKHMDFTDLPLLSPFLGNLLGSGERSTEETMTIVNSLVLSFFDCYLKGEGVFTAEDIY